MRRTVLHLLTLLVALALVAAACGDEEETAAQPVPEASEDSPGTSTGSTTTSTATEPPAEDPAPTATANSAEDPVPTATEPPTENDSGDDSPEPGDDVALVGAEAGDANVEEVTRFLGSAGEDDGPFYMVNLIRYRDRAEYPDGRASDLTGEEADSIYGEFMLNTKLPEIGAEIMYVGEVERELIAGTAFDRVAVVRYPSRAAFAAMAQDPEFQEMSIHKEAGVLDTVVMATSLIETPQAPPSDYPPFPATADDPAFAFMHVFDYHETAQYAEGDPDADPNRSGEDAVGIYSANAGSVAVPLGVRPIAWFDVEATIIGPVDTWDEVRINMFPSHATFAELTSDTTWQSGTHHRTAGLAETYAIMNLPRINSFSGVVAES